MVLLKYRCEKLQRGAASDPDHYLVKVKLRERTADVKENQVAKAKNYNVQKLNKVIQRKVN